MQSLLQPAALFRPEAQACLRLKTLLTNSDFGRRVSGHEFQSCRPRAFYCLSSRPRASARVEGPAVVPRLNPLLKLITTALPVELAFRPAFRPFNIVLPSEP